MATLSNAEIQAKALAGMQADSERQAIEFARDRIYQIAQQQESIARANAQIVKLKEELSKITIKDYSL